LTRAQTSGLIPNTALSFSVTPAFAASVDTSYSMTLAGSVTSSTVTGTPANGNLLNLTLTEDATGSRTFAFPANFIFTPTFTFNTTAKAINDLTFKFDGAHWQLISNSGAPSAPTNSLQKNNGAGGFVATSVSDTGSAVSVANPATATGPLTAQSETQFAGPNPWFDCRQFGCRAVTTAPSAKCTMTNHSAVASLTNIVGTFINGDGVVCRGAGPTPTMSTPAAPAVTPSNAGTTIGTGIFVSNTSGSTTYQYQVAAVDVLRGVTIASTVTSISNGPATLGQNTTNISSWTRSNNVVSVITSTAHNLVQFAGFTVTGDGGINGTYTVASVTDSTHFTFNTGMDTRNGAPLSGGSSGVLTYYLGNHISIPHTGGTFSISSISGTGTVVNVALATPYAALKTGGMVTISGVTTTAGYNGTWSVASVTDSTHFAFTSAVTGTGRTDSATASFPGAQMYLIYGRNGGSMTLIGATLPDQGSNNTDPLYNTFDDYGSTLTIAPTLGNWAPTTPPAAVKNDDLVTTIVSGAGTSRVTLANTASHNANATNLLFDNTVALVKTKQAAIGVAQTGQNGIMYIPVTPSGQHYITNAVLNLSPFPSKLTVIQGGSLALGDTMQIGLTDWIGVRNPQFSTSFSFDKYVQITSGTAYPMISAFNQWNMQYVSIVNQMPGGVGFVDDGAGNAIPGWQLRDATFAGTGSNDYLGRYFICRNNINGGANVYMDHVTFSTPTLTTSVPTPVLINTQGWGPFTLANLSLGKRGIYLGASTNGIQGRIIQSYCQGCLMPKITIENSAGGNVAVSLNIETSIEDTTSEPIVAVGGGLMTGTVRIFGSNGEPLGTLVSGSGQLVFELIANGSPTQAIGQNMGTTVGPVLALALDGVLANRPSSLAEKLFNTSISSGTPYQIFSVPLPPTAPVCSALAGGTISIGNHAIQIAAIYPSGGEGPLSLASNKVTTTGTNRTISCTWTPVPGATGYDWYRDGFSVQLTAPLVTPGSASSYSWNGNPFGGASGPVIPGSGPVGFSNTALWSPLFTMVSTDKGGQVNVTMPTATATRTVNFPNASGNVGLTSNSMTNPAHLFLTRSDGTIADSGVAPMSAYDSFNRPNGKLQAGNVNWTVVTGAIDIASNVAVGNAVGQSVAVYTGVSWPTDDQTVRITLSSGTGPGASAAIRLRSSSTVDSGYTCLSAATSGSQVLSMYRVSSGTYTQLGSNVSYVPAKGDVLSCNATGTIITLYVNGVQKIQQTDATFASGYPGIQFTGNAAAVTADDWMASYGAVSLNVAQTWAAQQSFTSGLTSKTYSTSSNCSSKASPAVCGAAAGGSVTVAASATSVTVNSTAVTANSQIIVTEDSSLSRKLSVTCNTTIGRTYAVTTRTAGTSFVITASAAPTTNPACLSYLILN
jgi:hypothetical protein